MDIVEHTAELEQSARSADAADAQLAAIEQQIAELEQEVTRWRITVAGAYVAAALASDDYLADDTTERAETMLRRYELAERLADQEAGG